MFFFSVEQEPRGENVITDLIGVVLLRNTHSRITHTNTHCTLGSVRNPDNVIIGISIMCPALLQAPVFLCLSSLLLIRLEDET